MLCLEACNQASIHAGHMEAARSVRRKRAEAQHPGRHNEPFKSPHLTARVRVLPELHPLAPDKPVGRDHHDVELLGGVFPVDLLNLAADLALRLGDSLQALPRLAAHQCRQPGALPHCGLRLERHLLRRAPHRRGEGQVGGRLVVSEVFVFLLLFIRLQGCPCGEVVGVRGAHLGAGPGGELAALFHVPHAPGEVLEARVTLAEALGGGGAVLRGEEGSGPGSGSVRGSESGDVRGIGALPGVRGDIDARDAGRCRRVSGGCADSPMPLRCLRCCS